MSPAGWIPLAGGVVAVVGAGCTAGLYLIRRLRKRYFSVRCELNFPYRDPIHITQVENGEKGFSVNRLGLWAQCIVSNTGTEPQLLGKVFAYETGSSPREVLGPVKNLHCTSQGLTPEGTLLLPLRLDPHSAVHMWFLIEVELPFDLASAIGGLYGIDKLVINPHYRHKLKTWKEAEKYAFEHLHVPGIIVDQIRLPSLTVGSSLIDTGPNDQVGLKEILARLPIDFYLRLSEQAAAGRVAMESLEATGFKSFTVELALEGKRSLRKIAFISDAFWFLHMDEAFNHRLKRSRIAARKSGPVQSRSDTAR
jgi:hypothetical protein